MKDPKTLNVSIRDMQLFRPGETEDRLFRDCSPAVRQLEKQSRREKRLAKRKEWKAGSLMEETSNGGSPTEKTSNGGSPVRRKKDV